MAKRIQPAANTGHGANIEKALTSVGHPGGAPRVLGHTEDDSGHIHHPPASLYFKIYGLLMGLLVLTVIMYYIDLSRWIPIPGINLIIAMMIAVPKASLVVYYFMNIKGSTRLTWLWAGLGFLWLFILAGIFMDYLSRAWLDVPGWE